MSKQMPEKVVLAFKELDEKFKKLSEKRSKMMAAAIEKYGVDGLAEGCVEIAGEDKPFFRVKISDQLKTVEANQKIHVSTYFTRFDLKVDQLKNKPKNSQ